MQTLWASASETACRLVVGMLCVSLAGCGGSGEGPPAPTCGQFGGVWSVAIDYGNGLIAHQQWGVSQSGCDLQLSGNPSDPYGPLLNYATGTASDGGFWARWSNFYAACEYVSDLSVTITGNSLSGTLTWARGSYGQGYCPGNFGQMPVSGQR